jgi:hypothetical protein
LRSSVFFLLVLSLAAAGFPTAAQASTIATPVAPAFVNYPATGGVGQSAGEPSLGYEPATGDVFFQAGSQILRVRFDDTASPASALWQNAASGFSEEPNVDPIAASDAVTGRVFAGGLEGGCSLLSYSDDDGASWTLMPDACTVPAFDHPTVGSGPWRADQPQPPAYPRAVYYCAQGEVEECAVSPDGGLTFDPPVVVSTACLGPSGHVKVAPDGTAYVPARNCSGHQDVSVSADDGLTWTSRPITPSTVFPGLAGDPSVGVTRQSGWVYASWLGANGHAYVSLSKDQAATWSPATDVGASVGVLGAEFPAVVAGDDDRAAVAFLGTTDPGDPYAQSFTGTWDLYVASTTDAGASWTTVKVSTDPVQRGWICTSGTTCPTNTTTFAQPGRNLLDFIDATTDARGRVLVAYADGCIAACAQAGGTVDESQSALGTIARQVCGPSLFASVGEVEGPAGCPTGAPPPPPPPPSVQTGAYVGPVGDVLCATPVSNCIPFAVPPGATSVQLSIKDAVSPHVPAYYCLNSCAGTTAYFCDGTTLALTSDVTGVIVVIDPEGLANVVCATHQPQAPVEGTVTARFS